ncbi:MAG TPA: hypothetical protein VM243_06830 [Phycisphaerae bacterium]|nr:hypothetical protein [Phycisphaerae bacterium]
MERVERGLSIRLGQQLRGFTTGIGNLRVDPFNIVVAGDDEGRFSTVTETQCLWSENPPLRKAKFVKLMEHAGEIYLYNPDTERVAAYDAFRPVTGEETLTWESFDQFVEWVFEEARAIAKGQEFCP